MQVVLPDWLIDSDGIYVYHLEYFQGKGKHRWGSLYTFKGVETRRMGRTITEPFAVEGICRDKGSASDQPFRLVPLGESFTREARIEKRSP